MIQSQLQRSANACSSFPGILWGGVLEHGVLLACNDLLFMCLQLLMCSQADFPFRVTLKVAFAMTCSIVDKEKNILHLLALILWEARCYAGLPIASLLLVCLSRHALLNQPFGCLRAELLEKLIAGFCFNWYACVISKWLRLLIISLCPFFEAWQENLLANVMTNFSHYKLGPSSVLCTVCEKSCQYRH